MTLGHGSDVWYGPTGLISGRVARKRQNALLRLFRMFTTRSGTLPGGSDAKVWGVDLSELIGEVGYETAVKALPGIMRSQVRKDDSYVDLDVTATLETNADGTQSITLDCLVTLQGDDQPLPLTLSVNEVTVKLLRGLA